MLESAVHRQTRLAQPVPTSRHEGLLGHESAGLTLDRYGHLYGSDVEAVGMAINQLLTRNCGQNVGKSGRTGPGLQALNGA
jgi:hypothetical protein